MNSISRYILRNHIGPFLFGTFTVLFLFIFQFLSKFIDQIVGKGLSEWVIIQLIALNTAWMIVLSVPMGVLFSTLMAFGGMSAAHEITIVKASGGSLKRMMFPVVISGMVVTLLLFWFNDEILPEANHKAKILMSDIKRKKPTFSIDGGQFYTDLDGYSIFSRDVDSLSGLLKGVTIYDNTKRRSKNIVNADSGTVKFNDSYTKLVMHLTSGEIHQFIPNDLKSYRKVKFNEYNISMDAKGFAFNQSGENVISRGDREMHIRDMQKIVDESQRKATSADSTYEARVRNHYDYIIYGVDNINEEEINEQHKRDSTRRLREEKRLERLRTDSLKYSRNPEKYKTELEKVTQALSRAEERIDNLKPKLRKLPVKEKETDIYGPGSNTITLEKDKSVKKEIKRDTSRVALLNAMQRKLASVKADISPAFYQSKDHYNRIRKYEVEIYKKYAIPFACFVFVFVGCPLGIMTRRGNFGISAAISLAFYIVYWACLIAGEKLADRGHLSPFLSMWMGNFVVGIMGIILTVKVNNETMMFPGQKYFVKIFRAVKLLFGKK